MRTDIWRPPQTAHMDLDGEILEFIPIGPNHRDLLARSFENLSEETRYNRFLAPVRVLSEAELTYLTDLDMVGHFAWGVVIDDRPVAVGRYARTTSDPAAVEVGLTVVDEFQAKGVGTVLLQSLAVVARQAGFERLEFEVLADNAPMLTMLRRLGAKTRHDSGIVHGQIDAVDVLPPPIDENVLLDAVGSARAARNRTA